MALPGFTAEASIGPPAQQYQAPSYVYHAITRGYLHPQQLVSDSEIEDVEIPHEELDEGAETMEAEETEEAIAGEI